VNARIWSVLGLCCVLYLGCARARPAGPSLPPRDYPGVLEDTHALGRPFLVRQSLHGHYGLREISLEVVVQLANGKLTLVGLTPFGSRAFVLEQDGLATRFQKFVNREIPFDPSHVLNDLHRVFFRGLAGPLADGVHGEEREGERISERWRSGVLVERRFERLDHQPEGAVVIRYSGAPAPVIAPEVTLENQWFGYTLRIENGEQQWLAAPEARE
jgi:hypothetical protein